MGKMLEEKFKLGIIDDILVLDNKIVPTQKARDQHGHEVDDRYYKNEK